MICNIDHYEVTAYNSARNSENRMHDDTVAKKLGFSAGLVPGVDLVAYLSHLPLGRWGANFLANGELCAKLLKPVYEGDLVTISATDVGDRLNLVAKARGEICAEGHAATSDGEISFDLADYGFSVPPEENDRPEFGAGSLLAGSLIGTRPHAFTRESHAEHLESVRETNPLYSAQHIIHPGSLSRLMNYALSQNFRLGPWIHASANLRLIATAHVGDQLTVRAKVIRNDRKGDRHRVELEGLVVANDIELVAHITHKVYIPSSVI